jgi:uncharacterized protein (TIGR02145 family)
LQKYPKQPKRRFTMNTRITHHIFNPVNPLIGGIGVQTIFTAILALAITFTLSCSGGDDGGDSSSSGISSSDGLSSSDDGNESSSSVEMSSNSEQAHVHAWGDWVVTTVATCTEAGEEIRTCTGDSTHNETKKITQLAWGEWTKIIAATCEAAGIEIRTCPGASPFQTQPIAQFTWSAWTVTTPATSTTVGVETRTCPGDTSLQTRPLYPKCNGVEYDPASDLVEKFCDERDGKRYKYVEINGQTWMAENLNYNAYSSRCYSDSLNNCAKYGRLYNWATAMDSTASSTANPSGVQGVCPSGWHLPSDTEWNALMNFVNPSCSFEEIFCAGAGTKLKATSGWTIGNNGTDDFGFSALPSDYDPSENPYGGAGWLSASEYDSNNAYGWGVGDDGYASRGHFNKNQLHSVRCVMD